MLGNVHGSIPLSVSINSGGTLDRDTTVWHGTSIGRMVFYSHVRLYRKFFNRDIVFQERGSQFEEDSLEKNPRKHTSPTAGATLLESDAA